jgi:hypothetical protein
MERIVTTSPKWLGTTFVAGCFHGTGSRRATSKFGRSDQDLTPLERMYLREGTSVGWLLLEAVLRAGLSRGTCPETEEYAMIPCLSGDDFLVMIANAWKRFWRLS